MTENCLYCKYWNREDNWLFQNKGCDVFKECKKQTKDGYKVRTYYDSHCEEFEEYKK